MDILCQFCGIEYVRTRYEKCFQCRIEESQLKREAEMNQSAGACMYCERCVYGTGPHAKWCDRSLYQNIAAAAHGRVERLRQDYDSAFRRAG